jgi:hypothetical protein
MTTSGIQLDQPLYDENQPIACSIGAAELPDHIKVIERLRTNMQSIQRTPHGVLLTLPTSSANAADMRAFAVVEKQCCPFWGFEVIEDADLMLRWDGPPDLAEYMDKLVDYFEGRAPIGILFTAL